VDDRLRSEIEQIVDEKVKESLRQDADTEFSKLVDRKIEEKLGKGKTQNTGEIDGNKKMDRRSFLKTLGLGAGGLALSSLGASNIRISDQGIKKDGQPLTPFLPGTNKIEQDLNLNGNQIKNVGAQKRNFNQKADLTASDGVLQNSQLPPRATTSVNTVTNQTERLALNAQEGDVAIQTDVNETYLLTTNDPTVDSNWSEVQLDVTGAISGQTITPSQTGTSTNRTDIVANTVDANSLTGVIQGCRVFLSSDQSIAAGSRPKIQFDSESYDSGNNFDTSSHNWTCPSDGLYAVNLHVRFGSGGNDKDRRLYIGTATSEFPNNEGSFNQQSSSDSQDALSVSTVNKYAQGDKIAAYVRNRSSADTLNSGSVNTASFLEVAFLGGL
jgi:hypothetical protein